VLELLGSRFTAERSEHLTAARGERPVQAIANAETVSGNAARLGRSAHAVTRQDAGT
jgi:hypothetical protein